ncbi:MAG: hypothetical protein ACK55I_15385, partial [bacterium]
LTLLRDIAPTVNLTASSTNITLPTNSINLQINTSTDVTSATITEVTSFGATIVSPVKLNSTTWQATINNLTTNSNGSSRNYTFKATVDDGVNPPVDSNPQTITINNQIPTAEIFIPSSTSGVNMTSNYTFGITAFAVDPDGGS